VDESVGLGLDDHGDPIVRAVTHTDPLPRIAVAPNGRLDPGTFASGQRHALEWRRDNVRRRFKSPEGFAQGRWWRSARARASFELHGKGVAGADVKVRQSSRRSDFSPNSVALTARSTGDTVPACESDALKNRFALLVE